MLVFILTGWIHVSSTFGISEWNTQEEKHGLLISDDFIEAVVVLQKRTAFSWVIIQTGAQKNVVYF